MNFPQRIFYSLFLAVILTCQVQTQNAISESLNAFAIDLLATTVSHTNKSANLALSPYTVWALLTVVDEGARGNTAKELETVLRIPKEKTQFRKQFSEMSTALTGADQDVELDLTTSIFATTKQKLKQAFRDVSKKYYGIDIRPVDFENPNQASQIINDHVAKATRNRIRDFIKPTDLEDAAIFMTSTLYFKGIWTLPFNKSATKPEPFYDENFNKIGETNMMFQMSFFPYSRIDFLNALAVEVPYGNNNKMSMILILPYKGDTISNVLNGLTKSSFRKVLDTLDKAKEDYADDDVQLSLPRFSITSDYNLNVILDKMGIKDVFDDQAADLLGMFPHYLWISRIVQKAEIEVNEEGTVATAASGAEFSYKTPTPKFLANRPFLYFIVDKPTKTIVFAGKISSPP